MVNNSYSRLSKFLHRFYLGNRFIAETSFDIEKTMFGKNIKSKNLDEIVFVSGLARSGTTALFNKLYDTNQFASLTYSNMPFLLMPNLWKKFNKHSESKRTERAHKDGIQISSDSPEEFDEYFWKNFLKNKFITKDSLKTHTIENKIGEEYIRYIKLICQAYGKNSYLSKNNNNILRLSSLIDILPNAKIIMLYRDPIGHAKSLLAQHHNFIQLQKEDPFALEYFNFLGHHEFGLNHKPFNFNKDDFDELKNQDPTNLNYWLIIWKNYYQYLLDHFHPNITLVCFEDICKSPNMVSNYLNKKIKLGKTINLTEPYSPSLQKEMDYDKNIANACQIIYEKLNDKREYTI